MQKISPFIWFVDNAEEAVNYYMTTFKNAKIVSEQRYDAESAKVSGRPEGSIMVMDFEIEGQSFQALNGGVVPGFERSSMVSFVVNCENQEELDSLWNKLTDGGQIQQCGWCVDKFGVTWQIIPRRLNELLADPDKAKAGRVMHAMLQMKKIIIADLEKAAQT
ncbi:VOC family protein [Patescibacteria group bacterium]|jgi:predicted 3-demethylubiquinone-9 3-methyltransferase (glyoxalase superfamily)|nr:VOC family protein [Patescibacteria group bacterium]